MPVFRREFFVRSACLLLGAVTAYLWGLVFLVVWLAGIGPGGLAEKFAGAAFISGTTFLVSSILIELLPHRIAEMLAIDQPRRRHDRHQGPP